MNRDLSNYRRSYDKKELTENQLTSNPMDLFDQWFKEVEAQNKEEVNAFSLSTVENDGFPRTRVVLLKQYGKEGFVFFTNYFSKKGKAIEENPKVCMSFFWESMERQVIIKGIAEKISAENSDEYFNSRPLESRIGAIASQQSSVLANREILENKVQELQKLPENLIKRPENWGGFLIKPISIEFWQGRTNRLHDRIVYSVNEGTWNFERLYP